MKKERVSIIGIVVNCLLSVLKISAGIVSKSSAVVAEGIHSGMDIVSSFISYLGIKVAKKPVDEKHPYGHYKSEVIAGLIITIILLMTSLWIIYDAIVGFLEPRETSITFLTLGVMFFSSVINEVVYRIKIKCGKEYESMALIADAQHSRVDVLVSSGVFVALFFVNYWRGIDSLIALLIGAYIFKESVDLGRKATDSLLDVSAGKEFENRIKEIVEREGIELSGIKTRKLGSIIFAELKIKLNPRLRVDEASAITKKLEEKLTSELPNLKYVVIQIESHEIKEEFYRGFFGGMGWRGRGPGGECVCPNCGTTVPHRRGIPCRKMKCPKCGFLMKRKR